MSTECTALRPHGTYLFLTSANPPHQNKVFSKAVLVHKAHRSYFQQRTLPESQVTSLLRLSQVKAATSRFPHVSHTRRAGIFSKLKRQIQQCFSKTIAIVKENSVFQILFTFCN